MFNTFPVHQLTLLRRYSLDGSFCLVLALLIALSGGWVAANAIAGTDEFLSSADPKQIQPADVSNRVIKAADYAKLSAAFPAITVDGEMPYRESVLVAKAITFKPGARLVVSDSNFYLVTGRLIVEGSGPPAVIAWQRGDAPPAPPARLRAPGGLNAVEDGSPGLPGAKGETGTPGPDGRRAPYVTVVASQIEGSGKLLVDLRG